MTTNKEISNKTSDMDRLAMDAMMDDMIDDSQYYD